MSLTMPCTKLTREKVSQNTYIQAVGQHHHGQRGVGTEVARIWVLGVVHGVVEDVHSVVCMQKISQHTAHGVDRYIDE